MAFNYQLLQTLRHKEKMSLRDVSFGLHDVGFDVSEQTVGNWETGRTEPDAGVLVPLAKVFKIKPEELLAP